MASDKKKTEGKRVDRRVLRTKALLREAMLSLIKEKSYTGISVQDITDHANLNRATFYLHYQGKEDLLIDSLEWHFDVLMEEIDQALGDTPMIESALPEQYAFTHVAQYKELYEVLLSETGPGFVMQRMIDAIARFGIARVQSWLPEGAQVPLPLEVTSQFVAGGLFALLRWWIQSGMPHSPETMAKIAHSLTNHGVLMHFQLDFEQARAMFGWSEPTES